MKKIPYHQINIEIEIGYFWNFGLRNNQFIWLAFCKGAFCRDLKEFFKRNVFKEPKILEKFEQI